MSEYMVKAKTTGEFAAVEVSSKSSFGVRAGAKGFSIDWLQKSSTSQEDPTSYLQLRSRRLERLPPPVKKHEAYMDAVTSCPNPSYNLNQHRVSKLASCYVPVNYVSVVSSSLPANESEAEVELSCGKNILEVEEPNRKKGETKPCSIIQDSEDLRAPGSSTRLSNMVTTNFRIRSPTFWEMEEFFAGVEQSQLKLFTEKYNYDPVNDCPLPGRYEWIKLE